MQFLSGKALIYDKIKNKQDWVNFTATVAHPRQMRMDVYLGLLNIPLGVLVIDDNNVVLVSSVEKKIYKTTESDRVIEKLLKTSVSSREIISIFSEKLPLGPEWTCDLQNASSKCQRDKLNVTWDKAEDDKKTLTLDGPKAKIEFVYLEKGSGKSDFKLKEPSQYEIINL